MSTDDLYPVRVVKFSNDYLFDFVRHKTNWSQRSEVTEKKQLNYLIKYLRSNHIRVKTIVVENEYIDRNYLEDYSEYYARCFPHHSRTCARLHFFSSEFSEQDFIKNVVNNRQGFINSKIKSKYIGFIVIRPIPETIIAKACIQPYKALNANPPYKLILNKHHVSLFGINLEVNTAAFIEQDKVLSACATSAIWTLLSSSANIPLDSQPSPSAITKAATDGHQDAGRIFPSKGLSAPQVERCLKAYSLEPQTLWIEKSPDWDKRLKEYIYSYVNNNIPILIGGNVYRKNSHGYVHLGQHLICALGYKTNEELEGHVDEDLKLRSHKVDRIYVHDDRFGPFVRMTTKPLLFEHKDETLKGLELSFKNDVADIFVPENIILGVYHKIRLSYEHIENVTRALVLVIKTALRKNKNILRALSRNKTKSEITTEIIKCLEDLLLCETGISVTTNNKAKNEILNNNNFHTFNGSTDKTSFLFKNLPKFMWQCKLFDPASGQITAYLLFDATEVPQGRIFVGFISCNQHADRAWKHITEIFTEREWRYYNLSEDVTTFISPFLKFFNDASDSKAYLNTLYGPIGIPARDTKDGELDEIMNINRRTDVEIIRRGSNSSTFKDLDKGKEYIWVINESGDLVIGEDIVGEHNSMGHTTLVDGQPARIAGELLYKKRYKKWYINLKSRAYSSHLVRGSDQSRIYLENVQKYNFHPFKVTLSL